VCDLGRVFGRALRPCYGVPWAGQLDALQPTVEHAGDGPDAIHRRGGDAVDELADVVPGELVLPQLMLQRLPGVLVPVPPRLGVGEPGLDPLVDLRVQSLPDGSAPQGEQVAGSAGLFLGLADLLGGGQVAGVALQDTGEHGFGGGLLVGLVPGRSGLASDHMRGVGFTAARQSDVQGLPGQGFGDEEVGGVHGMALGDVDVAGVGELGVSREVGPGDPERPGPGPVRALAPHLGVGAAERGDPEGVAVGELAAAGVDLGVQPGADQIADAAVVAVGQRGLRRADAAHLSEPGLDATG
jgi:hypothetical protein